MALTPTDFARIVATPHDQVGRLAVREGCSVLPAQDAMVGGIGHVEPAGWGDRDAEWSTQAVVDRSATATEGGHLVGGAEHTIGYRIVRRRQGDPAQGEQSRQQRQTGPSRCP